MKQIYTLPELPKTAAAVLANAPHRTLLFYGGMGVGKTTLIAAIAKKLGVTHTVTSPTYALVNEYEGRDGPVFHFDFYRITNETEAHDIGFEEYLDKAAYVFIEWPEKIKNILPKKTTNILLSTREDGARTIKMGGAIK
ncbi:MAG: tRNA (adenosine(37)-N6)-threonylcarbamoyltransferase complex ATPase subunit type 1 TsaE [Marinirhabdus sp.]